MDIFARVKQLRGTNISIANDLTESQRGNYRVLKSNLLRAREDTSLKSFIRGNRLIVGNKEYIAEDLLNESQEKGTQSGSPTPSTSGRQEGRDKNEDSEDIDTVCETTGVIVEEGDQSERVRNLISACTNETLKIQKTEKPPRKKTPKRKDSKLAMKLRTRLSRM